MGAWGPQALSDFHIPNPGRLRGSCWGGLKRFWERLKMSGEIQMVFGGTDGVGGD